jgi:hypothetical protein
MASTIYGLCKRAFDWGLTRYYTIGYGVLLIIASRIGLGDILLLTIGALVCAGSLVGLSKRWIRTG